MWSGVFRGTALPALEQTIQFAERRHEILATNVANADTPGYQTRDLSVENFQSSLKNAIAAEKQTDEANLSPGMTMGNGFNRLSKDQAMQNVRESMDQILYHDGTDISFESQVTQIAKNQSMHSTAVAVLRNQFKVLQMAISESVNV